MDQRQNLEPSHFGNHYDTPKSGGSKKHHHSSKTEETTVTPVVVQTLQTLASPKTGDSANVLLWGAFAAAALLGVAVMILITVRNGRRKEDSCKPEMELEND